MSLEYRLSASSWCDIPKNTRVINIKDAQYELFIQIPYNIAINYNIYSVIDTSINKKMNMASLFQHKYNSVWYEFLFDLLGKSAGRHTYRMDFVHRETHDLKSLYFSYIIVNENTDKPYIYVKR